MVFSSEIRESVITHALNNTMYVQVHNGYTNILKSELYSTWVINQCTTVIANFNVNIY